MFIFSRSKTKERSQTVLLLKNFPFGTEEEELRRLAAKFGTIARFLMPPNRSLAMAEFAHEQEARKGVPKYHHPDFIFHAHSSMLCRRTHFSFSSFTLFGFFGFDVRNNQRFAVWLSSVSRTLRSTSNGHPLLSLFKTIQSRNQTHPQMMLRMTRLTLPARFISPSWKRRMHMETPARCLSRTVCQSFPNLVISFFSNLVLNVNGLCCEA